MRRLLAGGAPAAVGDMTEHDVMRRLTSAEEFALTKARHGWTRHEARTRAEDE